MERRVLFAIFLCFLVLYLWQALFVKPVPRPAAGADRRRQPAPRRRARRRDRGASTAAAGADAAPRRPAATAAPVVGETAERDIRVETDDVIAVFTNRGARLKSWRLKHYLDQQKQPQELIESEPPAAAAVYAADAGRAGERHAERRALRGDAARRTDRHGSSAPARPICDSNTATAPAFTPIKEFHLDPSSYVVTLPRDA